MCRLLVMSWCWNFLVDFLWIPLVAYTQDLGLSNSMVAGLFAANLGARLVPNLVTTLAGIRSEFAMMVCVLLGYLVAMLRPTDIWALYFMAACSGMGFIRACLSLHPRMVFGEGDEGLAQATRYSGAARNLGTLTALVLPVTVYRWAGWSGVCAVAMAAVLLYVALAATQHILFGSQPGQGSSEPAGKQGEAVQAAPAPIPWILWVMGAAFVVLELQMNICNAAVPTALTRTFGLEISTAGHFLAFTNGASMCFLAWLPSAPRWAQVLHKSPMNILLAFSSIFAAWCAAVVATVYPLDGLGLFVPGVLTFMLAAYMAQVLMLECLTGVLEVHESKLLMGVSETVGCVFAALGGYLGDELEVYGAAAPFAMQASVALVTVSVLAACLGHRMVTQLAPTRPPSTDVEGKSEGWVRQSISGLSAMRDHPGSFVSSEREYRRWSSSRGALSEPLLAGSDTEERGSSPASLDSCASLEDSEQPAPRDRPAEVDGGSADAWGAALPPEGQP